MGIFIGKHNRRSTSWIGRFDPTNQQDMREYDIVKSIVKVLNANYREKFSRYNNRFRCNYYHYRMGRF